MRFWHNTTLAALALPLALAGAPTPNPPAPKPIMASIPVPAGWHVLASSVATGPGWNLPAAQRPIMAEYGLQVVEDASLQTVGSGRVQVRGFYFHDGGGAFGAFTYLRPDDASPERVGTVGVRDARNTVWFTRGRWLVEVASGAGGAVASRALQTLSATLGDESGPQTELPVVPFYLPRANQAPNSLRYAEGPDAFAAFCPWLLAAEVGFDRSAEAALARYPEAGSGGGTELLVISYPTPQMARTRLSQFQDLRVGEVRRSGSLLVIAHGGDARADAALVNAVNFDADITMTPSVPVGVDALPGLILGILVLCGLLIAIAVVVGLLTGTVWAWLERALPARFRGSEREALIRLHLDQSPGARPGSQLGSASNL